MDYQKLKGTLIPFFQGDSNDVTEVEALLCSIQPENSLDKRVIVLLRNIMTNAKIGTYLSTLGIDILNSSEYFSDKNLNIKEKYSRLDQLLADGIYPENEKLFNLSMFRIYLENILDKQLYEINLKIEENQRLLQTIYRYLPPKEKKGQ